MTMSDQSHLDSKYFIDPHVYNCPFCKRRHVMYTIESRDVFDWSNEKKCVVLIVKCRSCEKRSMHLTFEDICAHDGTRWLFKDDINIDEKIFYSVPTSFFALDRHIPRTIRELFTEAEGCLKSNFLTGASACARKVVYELAVDKQAKGENYEERIKSLKARLPDVDPTYFDTLLTIQEVTSDKVHEKSYDGWQASHLRLVLASLAEALQEIYVLPNLREEKRKAILLLKERLTGSKKASQDGGVT